MTLDTVEFYVVKIYYIWKDKKTALVVVLFYEDGN